MEAESSGDHSRGPFNNRDYQELYRFLLRHLPAQDVQDVVQEAYLRFLEVDPEILIRNPRGYIHGIACYVLRDFMTRCKNQRVSFDSEKTLQAAENPDRAQPDPISDQVSASQELEQVLEQLPLQQQKVLVLHKGHGLSKDEVAQVTGLSIHTVKKYATIALQQLRSGTKGGNAV